MPQQAIREQVRAAAGRIRTLKRIDRGASALIVLGGLGIVASVLAILVFIAAEAWPLFVPGRGHFLGDTRLVRPQGHDPGRALVLGVDEYQIYVYEMRPDGRLEFFRLADGTLAKQFSAPGIEGVGVTAASRSLERDFVAAGTADGRLSLMQIRFRPRYEEQKLVDLDIDLAERAVVDLDPGRRPVREVTYTESESGSKVAAALVGDDEIALWRSDESGTPSLSTLRTRGGERITRIRLGRTDSLVAGTEQGNFYHWEVGPEVRLTDVSEVGRHPITAIEWTLGGVTVVVGDAAGGVSGWFRARIREEDQERPMLRVHSFPSEGHAIASIAASTRDKTFATAGADGSVVLRHMTSERTIVRFRGSGERLRALVITPKNDGILGARDDGDLARYEISAPHPEVSLRALFGKVWYEGYSQPEYVWQSTGGTDDFETKFSLVPLVFGTIKGTIYALLFAVPVAVLGALYTSQFVHPSIRSKVKPTVEIMAALPSVVIGFIAGLWLASVVEKHVVAVLLAGGLMPLFGTAGVLLWGHLPRALLQRLKPGMELFLTLPLLVLGAWAAFLVAPSVEAALFGGDFKLWLANWGLTYDPRNSLVVGLAMGFAVIPIIFTISDDAFSSVPSNLTAASLALGASRWQTALKVVLPTASPGVFSAVMIGFGRAVGETMIVLMATGNTPVLDWSVFNGMRTLSANIAVEIPEAPYGGTLYRVLFLAGALLFTMTFIVNTIAEVIRQRLRERYRAL